MKPYSDNVLGRFAALFALSGLLATAQAQTPPPPLPPPFHSESVFNRPQVIPQPDGTHLQVPAGFHIAPWAEDFRIPRFMTMGPSGELLITDSGRNGTGAVYAITVQTDMSPGERRTVLEGLDRPYGLALWRDYLYVGEPGSVKRYRYDSATRMATTPGEEVISLAGLDRGHWTRTLLFDRDGGKLYVSVGSESNVSAGEDPRRAAINRYNPDGSGHEIFATGLRNVIGMRWYPGTDTLWAGTQERDGLGDDLVPDYFTSVRQGGFYGWPYAYIGPNEDPRRKDEAPELVQKAIVPDVLLGSHVAVLDVLFYTGSQFPERYRGGAFLAQHGSWNRSLRVGYNVMFLPFRDGKPAGKPEEFMTGFMTAPDKREVWGRPVGLLQLPDGSLLMSEDGGRKIWHITYRGAAGEPNR